MAHDDIGPGARVLWCLRRRAADVRCVAYFGASPVEVRVLQDTDVIIIEHFAGSSAAYKWASEYEAQLRDHGWRDRPADDDTGDPDVD